MSEARLPVVFGTDQAGSVRAAQLAGLGVAARAVFRQRPVTLAGGTDGRPTDGADSGVAADAPQGALVPAGPGRRRKGYGSY
jgi:hypothetical protein